MARFGGSISDRHISEEVVLGIPSAFPHMTILFKTLSERDLFEVSGIFREFFLALIVVSHLN